MEEWRDIINTNHEVSNLGKVRMKQISKDRKYKDNGRYRSIKIMHLGKLKNFYIHRLVAQAFLGLDINDPEIKVCHKNDLIQDNRVENLFLGTQADNIKDRVEKGRCRSKREENLQ